MILHVIAALALGQAPNDTLTAAEAVRIARATNPALAAARLRADAATHRVGPAGALPDPALTFGLMNRPLTGFGVDERMTMNSIGLMQMIPWPGRLGARREEARRLSTATAFDASETEAALVRQVQAAHHDLAFVDRALAVLEDTRGLLRQFEEVARARYAIGEALQQDVLRAQVGVAEVTQEIAVMEAERRAIAARLNALLGRDATVPIGPLSFATATAHLPLVDSLMALAREARPGLLAADERIAAADAGVRAARADLWPDLTVGITYGQRPAFDDMLSIMVGVSLPLWAGARQLPMRREMAVMRDEADAERRALANETYAEITTLHAQAVRADALRRLYDDEILPQARATVQSALAAYRVGRIEFTTLLDHQMAVNRYAIARLSFDVHYHHALIGLSALTGWHGDHQ
ncbi:MAG: TolC family protein [Gemmatimonadales bacterium]